MNLSCGRGYAALQLLVHDLVPEVEEEKSDASQLSQQYLVAGTYSMES